MAAYRTVSGRFESGNETVWRKKHNLLATSEEATFNHKIDLSLTFKI